MLRLSILLSFAAGASTAPVFNTTVGGPAAEWENCGSDRDVCPTTSVRIEPNPVEPGKEVVLEWACDAKEETRSGTIITTMYAFLFGIPIKVGEEDTDYCAEVRCPAPTGRRIIDTQFVVPADTAKASVRIDTTVVSEGQQVSCTRVWIDVGITDLSLPPVPRRAKVADKKVQIQ